MICHVVMNGDNMEMTKMTTLNDVTIIELLDRHSVDDFDDLLIEIMWHMKEQKELRERDDEEDR